MPTYVQWDGEDVDIEDIPENQQIPRRRRRDVEPWDEGTGSQGSGSRRRNVQRYQKKSDGQWPKENG